MEVIIYILFLIMTIIDVVLYIKLLNNINDLEKGYIMHSKILHALVDRIVVKEETIEDVLYKLDRKKYHVHVEMGIDENSKDMVMKKWVIYRKDMPTEEYFSDKNKPILSSENGNTIEDIKKLLEEEK